MWGSSPGFIHSSPRVLTTRCVLVGLCPFVSLPLRCWSSLEMDEWRNLSVGFPSQSSLSLWISRVSSSSGKANSDVVVHIFWFGICCWWVRRRRISSRVRMVSPSCGNLGSIVRRMSPFRMVGVRDEGGGYGIMWVKCTSSSVS